MGAGAFCPTMVLLMHLHAGPVGGTGPQPLAGGIFHRRETGRVFTRDDTGRVFRRRETGRVFEAER